MKGIENRPTNIQNGIADTQPIDLAKAGIHIPIQNVERVWGVEATKPYAEWHIAAVRHETRELKRAGGVTGNSYQPLSFNRFLELKAPRVYPATARKR